MTKEEEKHNLPPILKYLFLGILLLIFLLIIYIIFFKGPKIHLGYFIKDIFKTH